MHEHQDCRRAGSVDKIHLSRGEGKWLDATVTKCVVAKNLDRSQYTNGLSAYVTTRPDGVKNLAERGSRHCDGYLGRGFQGVVGVGASISVTPGPAVEGLRGEIESLAGRRKACVA